MPTLSLACVCGGHDVGPSVVRGRTRSGEELDIRSCVRCGLARTYPPPTVAALKEGFYQSEAGFADQAGELDKFRRFARVFFNIVRPRIRLDGQRLLDVGCGVGALVGVATELGYDAMGVDINAQAVEFGRNRLGLNLRVEDVDVLRSEGERFDMIVLSQVLEHLERPQETIRSLVSMTTPNGVVVIESPNMAGLYPRILGPWWYPYGPTQHLWHFTPTSIAVVAEAADVDLIWKGALRCVDYGMPSALRPIVELPARIGMGDNLIAIFRARA